MAGYPPPGPYGGPPPGAYGAPPPFGQYPPQQWGAPPASAVYPPPPDPLWGWFSAVAGSDQQIDAEELQRCMSDGGMSAYPRPGGVFSLETCRVMIAMLDRDNSGKLGYPEFQELWTAVNGWKTTFQSSDRDRSGSIESSELKAAILSFGFHLSDQAITVVTKRYSKRTGHITFDDFIALSVRLRATSEQFRRRDTTGQGYATLYYDDFICMTMAL